METRLLLSGNQTSSGELDTSIWFIDSPGNDYVVISQGDSNIAPAAAVNNPTPSISMADDTNSDYLSSKGQFSLTPSLEVPPVVGNMTLGSNTLGVITAVAGNFGNNGTLALDGTSDSDISDIVSWRNSLSSNGASLFDRTSYLNAVGSISGELEPKLGPQIETLKADAAAHGLGGGFTLITSPLANASAITPVFESIALEINVVQPVDSASIGESISVKVIVAAPPTSLTGANVAASKVETPLKSAVADPVAADKTSADTVVAVKVNAAAFPAAAAILPARQRARDERLAEAIDELLSEDTIIVSPSGQSGSEYVVEVATDGSTSDLAANGQSGNGADVGEPAAQPFVDGGMIPLDVIVAATAESSTAIVSPDTQLALHESNDVVGELSRVAVMELIEGHAEPGAPQAADRVILVAAEDTSSPLEVVEAVTRRAGVAISLAMPAGHAYVATMAGAVVDAASRAMASVVGSNLTAGNTAAVDIAPGDAARSEAFSLLGGDDDRSPIADEGHCNPWLAVAPLAVAVACERALAAKMKRQQQRDPARPSVKAK